MDARLMVTAGVSGFRESMDRYNAVHDVNGTEAEHFVPLVQALWWAQSIDEVLGKRELETYRGAPGRDEDLFQGLRYARNVANHNLAMVLSFQTGRTLPFTLPAPLAEFRWRPEHELPKGKRPDEKGKAGYIARLEGQPATATLVSVWSWFSSETFRQWR